MKVKPIFYNFCERVLISGNKARLGRLCGIKKFPWLSLFLGYMI
jgi:hypothetical protein